MVHKRLFRTLMFVGVVGIGGASSLLAESPAHNKSVYRQPTLEEALGKQANGKQVTPRAPAMRSASTVPTLQRVPTVGAPASQPMGRPAVARQALVDTEVEDLNIAMVANQEPAADEQVDPVPVAPQAPRNQGRMEAMPRAMPQPQPMDDYGYQEPYMEGHSGGCNCHPSPYAYAATEGVGCDSPCDAMGDCSYGGCDGCCLPCDNVCDFFGLKYLLFNERKFVTADYLLWYRRGQSLPPLVTSSPAATTRPNVGVLPAATVQYGDAVLGDGSTSGFRFEIGHWLDNCKYRSLTFRAWGSGKQTLDFFADQTDFPKMGRPYFDGGERAIVLTFTGEQNGSISVTGNSEVYGGDFLMRRLALAGMGGRIDWLLGYQTMFINEDVSIVSSTTTLVQVGVVPPGTTTINREFFDVENRYHAAAFGLQGHYREGPLGLEALFKMGFGQISRTATLSGVELSNGVPVANGGLLVRDSNRGTYRDSDFAVSPEIQLSLSYQLTRKLDFTFGYSFIAVDNAIQPDDAIDRVVSFAAGAQRPRADLEPDPYWLQGIHFGLDYNY